MYTCDVHMLPLSCLREADRLDSQQPTEVEVGVHTPAPGEAPMDLRPGAIKQINDKTNAVCVINAQGA